MSPAQPRRTLACIAGMSLLLAAACASPIKVEHDSDPAADFTRYKSYAWIKAGPLIGPSTGEEKPSYISPIDDQRILAAARRFGVGVDGSLLPWNWKRLKDVATHARLVFILSNGERWYYEAREFAEEDFGGPHHEDCALKWVDGHRDRWIRSLPSGSG